MLRFNRFGENEHKTQSNVSPTEMLETLYLFVAKVALDTFPCEALVTSTHTEHSQRLNYICRSQPISRLQRNIK